MKSLVLHFDEEEFGRLKQSKQNLSWREFILTLLPKKSGSDSSKSQKVEQ